MCSRVFMREIDFMPVLKVLSLMALLFLLIDSVKVP